MYWPFPSAIKSKLAQYYWEKSAIFLKQIAEPPLYLDPQPSAAITSGSPGTTYFCCRGATARKKITNPFLDPFPGSPSSPRPFLASFFFIRGASRASRLASRALDPSGPVSILRGSRPSACQRRFKGISTVSPFSPWNSSSRAKEPRGQSLSSGKERNDGPALGIIHFLAATIFLSCSEKFTSSLFFEASFISVLGVLARERCEIGKGNLFTSTYTQEEFSILRVTRFRSFIRFAYKLNVFDFWE